jgi:hypothetical protein
MMMLADYVAVLSHSAPYWMRDHQTDMLRKQKKISRIVAASEARRYFSQITHRASGQARERFIIDSHGKPKIVILGFSGLYA